MYPSIGSPVNELIECLIEYALREIKHGKFFLSVIFMCSLLLYEFLAIGIRASHLRVVQGIVLFMITLPNPKGYL